MAKKILVIGELLFKTNKKNSKIADLQIDLEKLRIFPKNVAINLSSLLKKLPKLTK